MAALAALSATDAEHVLAQFSAPVENVTAALNWLVEPLAPGAQSTVVQAFPRAGGLLVDLKLSPGLSSGVNYRFTALHATAAGAALPPLDKVNTLTYVGASVGAPDTPHHKLFSAIMQAKAEEFALVVGKPQTLVVDTWETDWDVLPVESTLRFPDSGRFWLDGEKYTYTSRTPTSFRGVTSLRPVNAISVSPKALVTLDLSSTNELECLPFTEQAFRETVTTRAPEDALKWLSQMYQLPCPAIIKTEYWRHALREVLYAARGTRGNMHMFLEKALENWNERFVCTTAHADPQKLTWVSGGSAGGFEAKHVGRLLRIGDGLYYSVGPTFIGGAVSGYLDLCKVGTAQWTAAKFQENATVHAAVLPFIWTDAGAVFYLWGQVAGGVPATYLQPAVMWGASSAGGVPFGNSYPFGADKTEQPAWGSPATFAAYVVKEETAGTWRYLIVNADNETVPARGGSHIVTLYKVPAGGAAAATALTCTLAAAGTTGSDLAHSATFAAGDIALLQVFASVGVTAPLGSPRGAFRASIYIDPPAGEPKGGYLLESSWVKGDQAVGPWPIYLGTELDAELMLIVARLLAAGVVPYGKQANFEAVNALL